MSPVLRSALLAALLFGATRAQAFTPTAPLNTNAYFDSGSDRRVELAADELGTMIAVWTSTDTLDGLLGGDRDILYARSENAGASWSDPLPLAAEFLFDSAADLEPRVTTDGAGNWIAVWRSQDAALSPDIFDGALMVATSADSGLTWSPPVYLDSGSSPRIASDRAGLWMIVWSSLGIAGADRDVVLSRSEDNGLSWSAGVAFASNAATDSGDDVLPVIANDEAGIWIAAWTSYDSINSVTGNDGDIVYARSLDLGLTWSSPLWLNANARIDTGLDTAVDLAADGAGHWVAVWHSFELIPWGGDGDILSARSSSDGVLWSMPRALYTFALIELGGEYEPRIATDRAGEWVVVWWREDSMPGSFDEDVDVLISRSFNHGAVWLGPELINPESMFDDGDDYAPSVATTRHGNWAVAWESTSSLDETIGSDFDILIAIEGCGDGVVDLDEECDDGNAVSGDCCSAACEVEPPAMCVPVPDAGVVDVGVADVGVVDGGAVDAGVADSGVGLIDAGLPVGGDSGVPVGIDAGVPVGVDAGVPVGIDAGLPVGVDAGLPIGVDAGLPIDIDAGLPIGVDAGLPIGVDAGLPIGVDAGLPIDIDAGLPIGVDAGLPIDVDAGLPIDIDAGLPIDADAGLPIAADSGTPLDPDSGVGVIDDAGGSPVHDDAGDRPLESDAGFPVIPIDAGTALPRPDAGPAAPNPFGGPSGETTVDFIDDQGCECNDTHRAASTPRSSIALLPLAALLLFRRRRRA